MNAPGRFCPARYCYGAAALAAAPELRVQAVNAVGGYLPLLDAIEALAAAEAGPVRLISNGDLHWFDVAPGQFEAVSRLRQTGSGFPETLAQLAALPMYAMLRIGEQHVGIAHGDADSLAGWGFDHWALDAPLHLSWLAQCLRAANVDVFASSPTPACRRCAASRWTAGRAPW